VNKTAATAALLAKCILLHAFIHVQLQLQVREHKQELHIVYLTSWHNSIFSYKLRTD